ncbi:hypothetical protein [Leclercia sp.]|uniref:hypothetical protein n=1 Tax=Leclercia sp. TaxID=1898428 RepID=UPI00289A5ABC|nr:hypothetical protein [Leclercia sp.]
MQINNCLQRIFNRLTRYYAGAGAVRTLFHQAYFTVSSIVVVIKDSFWGGVLGKKKPDKKPGIAPGLFQA